MTQPDSSALRPPPEFGQTEDSEPSTKEVIVGKLAGRSLIGLALKRTYRVGSRGGWEPVSEDEEEILVDGEVEYYEIDPPFCPPIVAGNDVLLRPDTDIVVQGSAYAYRKDVRQTTVGVRIGSVKRDIVVFGDRRVERDSMGDLRFSAPDPFESIPIRYDRAFGGVDLEAFFEFGSPVPEDLQNAARHLPFELVTPYHYPRNPAGDGFILSYDRYDLEDVTVPNLEYGFDPLTPGRMAVGGPGNWPAAPLPAGMDWSSAAWFPRLAYLGLTCLPDGFAGTVAEQDRGWAPLDLLVHPVITANRGELSPGYGQGASPGMVHRRMPLETIQRGIPAKFVNLHPDRPDLQMELPREWPKARLALGGPAMTDLEPHLAAVIIRPDEQEVVMLWAATTGQERAYTPAQYDGMASLVEWRRERRT